MKQVRAATGSQDEETSQNGYIGGGPDKSVIFLAQDVVEIFAERVTLGDLEITKLAQNGVFVRILCFALLINATRNSNIWL